jgi:hypothetical protein
LSQRRRQADHGSLSAERTHKLCGDFMEHVYEALRLTTHGTQCVALQWAAGDPELVIAATTSNCIGAWSHLRAAA